MKQLDLNSFKDFSQAEAGRRILVDDPVMRVVLVSIRAGQAAASASRGIPRDLSH